MKLPIDSYIKKIIEKVNSTQSVILKADPGTGKTTRLPIAIAEFGNTIVLEPRRLAAKLSAEYVAKTCGEECGQSVGYQVRFDHKVSPNTKLRYMTEGLFIRLLEKDPQLKDTKYIVLDEFHERHLDTDLSLAFIRHLQETSRPDLKLIVMSATVNLSSLEDYLPEAHKFDIPGTVFPVEINYKPYHDQKYMEDKVVQGVMDMAQRREYDGDILVFLTGFQQIKTCKNLLQKKLDQTQFQILCLSAELPASQQALVFSKSNLRKVILSTNVAETSITIPNITGVIDTGLAKESSFAPWSGLPMLQEKKISQASCIQRAGRAGRTQKGICYRLFDQNCFNKREEFTKNEILRSDLSQLILFLRSRLDNVGDISKCLHWLTPPPSKHVAACEELLERLGAITKNNQITEKGKFLVNLPVHPRLGSIIYSALKQNILEHGLIAVALISEDMILDRKSKAFEQGPCDITFQANILIKYLHGEEFDSIGLKKAIDFKRVNRVTFIYEQLRRVLGAKPLKGMKKFEASLMTSIIIEGFPDRVARYRPAAKNKRNPSQRSYHFCLGRGGILADYSTVKKSDYIVVLSAIESPGQKNSAIKTQIRFASSVKQEQLEKHTSMLRKEISIKFDEKTEVFKICESKYYGQICIEEQVSEARSEDVEILLQEKILHDWPYPFENTDCLDIYHRKLELMNLCGIEHSLPRFEGEYLELLIHDICHGKSTIDEIKKTSLEKVIYGQLSYEDQYFIDSMTPKSITVNGRSKKISYLGEHAPSITGKIQDFFGVQNSPHICQGALPLNLILLAPNGRPAQITKDLRGFWSGSYAEVRKELARRYPKHDWPENPTSLSN